MELQLGLALPIHNSCNGFDLNCGGFEPKEVVGSDALSGLEESQKYVKKKRGFEETFEKMEGGPKTLPLLLLWSGQPNEEDDWKGAKKRTPCTTINKKGGGENGLVGWPPIKSWRKKLFRQNTNRRGGKENDGSNSTYVKVKMEGVPIARKIDLKLFHSYHTLTNTLITMFAKYKKCDEGGASYMVTYQDKEGDWLLAGDVPWLTFTESVQRLEIRKRGG